MARGVVVPKSVQPATPHQTCEGVCASVLQTAQLLRQRGWLPGMVLSSNSRRTRQTLDAMKEAVDAFR